MISAIPRKPMTHDDPKTTVAKVVRKHFGYKLACQTCGKDVVYYKSRKIRQHLIKRGWRLYVFCSAECKRKGDETINAVK
jgi:ribosomal protein L36